MPAIELHVNGATHEVDADPGTPLLYVLMNDLALKGPRFGCGLAQCGACSVLADGREIRSCVTPVSAAQGREIVTLEGVPAWHAARSGHEGGAGLAEAPELHPLQAALITEQAPQCGYCVNGMVIKGAELLRSNPSPTREEIVAHMSGHLCRCGTYLRIVKAVERAAAAMKGSRA